MNMIRIEVRSKQLDRVRPYQGKNYGEQSAAIHNGHDFPLAFKVNVEEGKEYDPGEYTIDPRSFVTDQMGNLSLKRVRLLPVGGASAKR